MVPEGRSDQPLERDRVGRRGPDGRALPPSGRGERLGRRGAGSAAPARRDRAPAGTTGRRSGPATRKSGRSGSRQASHEAASSRRPRNVTTVRPRSGLDLVRLVARQAARRARVGPPGLHRQRPSLEVGGLRGGRRPDRLEAVPLLGRGPDRVGHGVGDRLGRALEVGRVVRRRPRSARSRVDPQHGRRSARWVTAARSATTSWRRAWPARPATSSRHRTGGPGSRRCGSPSRRGGRAARVGGARRRSPAGCATG